MKITPQVRSLLPLRRDGHRCLASKSGDTTLTVYSGAMGVHAANELEVLIATAVNAHEALVTALTECLANTGGGWIAASVVERARTALVLAGAA